MSEKSLDEWIEEALRSFSAGDMPAAERACDRALEIEAEDGEALHLRGLIELTKGKSDKAIEFLERATKAWPEEGEFWNNLGVALRGAEREEEAREAFVTAVQRDPNNAPARYNLGTSLKAKGDMPAAEVELRKAIELGVVNAQVHTELGSVLTHQGKIPEGLACFDEALAVDDRHGKAYLFRGYALSAMGKRPEAEDAFARAALAMPEDPRPHWAMGMMFHMDMRNQAAIVCHRRAIELDEKCLTAHLGLAQALAAVGKHEEAVDVGKRAVALAPKSAEAYYVLGVAMEKCGRKNEAGTCYRTAARLRPELERLKYIQAAMSGKNVPGAAPADYVMALFSEYAQKFETHLVDVLKYRAPEQLLESCKGAGIGKDLDMLDLGCGTGLVGKAFKPLARSIVGVDLVPQMLDVARASGVYDELVPEEINKYLATTQRRFDVVTAADVFIYIGDLSDIFPQTARVLKSGGLFTFSLEGQEEDDGFKLQESRRYSHGLGYIRKLARENGFSEARLDHVVVRMEQEKEVKGWVVVLKKE